MSLHEMRLRAAIHILSMAHRHIESHPPKVRDTITLKQSWEYHKGLQEGGYLAQSLMITRMQVLRDELTALQG